MANLCTSINLLVIHQARNQDVPEGDTVGNLHILWQTDSHCPTLAGSGEFTKRFLFQMLCNYKMQCKREGGGEWINRGGHLLTFNSQGRGVVPRVFLYPHDVDCY